MKTLILTLALLLLAACDSSGQRGELEDYLKRLARPLGINAKEVEVANSVAPPRAEALRIDVDGSKLEGLDFLRLRGCALQNTVARRNSSLGRVAPPSQRLLLELAFLRDAPACIDKLIAEGKLELAAVIKEAAALKETQLRALIFNATLGNREYRDFWRAQTPSPDYPSQVSSRVVTALEQVSVDAARWLAGDYQADDIGFELALSEIARGDGGELVGALAQQAAYLEAGNNILGDRIAKGALCSKTTRDPAANVVRSVVSKFFVARVQVRGADLNQRFYDLMAPINNLEALLAPAVPKEFREWRKQRDGEIQFALQAPSRHVTQLQSLLGACFSEFAGDKNVVSAR